MYSLRKFSLTRSGLALALAASVIVLFGFAFLAPLAQADVDPGTCSDNGGGISLGAFRADGTTNIGVGTVSDGEVIIYKATLSALGLPNCAFEGGTWSITTPDGVVHSVTAGGIERIGGSGISATTSIPVSYTVLHANEIAVQVNATTNYGGGISHATAGDTTPGPVLQASKQIPVIHTPVVTTNVHDSAHLATTSVALGTSVHDNAAVTGGSGTPTGTVDFAVFNNLTCSGATTTTQSGVALVAGVAESNATNTPSTGLSYKVHYNGQAGVYTPADGICEPLTAVLPKGHIIVDKVTNPSGDTQSFTFTTTGAGYSGFSLTDAAAPNNQELDPGTYSVAEGAVSGWDSNGGVCVSSTQGVETPASISLQAGETVTCTFTNTKRGSISGMKWNDINGNGIKDTGDNGLSGWTIGISTSSSATTTATTDGSGNYTFPNLVPGTYLVCEVAQTNWTETFPTSGCYQVTLTAGQSSTGNDFGNHQTALQYCSPGYWKQSQHFDSWVGYTQSQSFSSVFGRTITVTWSSSGKPQPLTNPTLLQALQANGGGISMLARVAVDALLNATALNSGFTSAQVISVIQTAIDTGNYQAAATQLTAPENCPLN